MSDTAFRRLPGPSGHPICLSAQPERIKSVKSSLNCQIEQDIVSRFEDACILIRLTESYRDFNRDYGIIKPPSLTILLVNFTVADHSDFLVTGGEAGLPVEAKPGNNDGD